MKVLKQLIEIFTDPGDVVIDPCAGSGSTLRAAVELGRSAYGFEIDRNFYKRATEEMLAYERNEQMSIEDFITEERLMQKTEETWMDGITTEMMEHI